MAPRILIAYASRYGSTEGIAREVARTLVETGCEAVVHRADRVHRVEPFDAVIVGAPTYFRRWLPEAEAFLRRHAYELLERPVALFSVGLPMLEQTAAHRAEALTYLQPGLTDVPNVQPVSVGAFQGALKRRDHPWPMRMLLTALSAPDGDYRDWPEIRAWTMALGFHLPARFSVLADRAQESARPE
jgi:menaquinone-dependent protoporphyrinogen oxidase